MDTLLLRQTAAATDSSDTSSDVLPPPPLPLMNQPPPPAASPSGGGAAFPPPPPPLSADASISNYYAVAHFTPSMIIVFVVLLAAFFFMAFFAVYIRRCTTSSSSEDPSPYYFTHPLHDRRWLWGRSSAAAAAHDAESAPPHRLGLDPSVVDTFPLVSFSSVKRKGLQECVVCLVDFDIDSDTHLRQLPRCKHFFHHACISQWLEMHATCPLCRRSLLPGSASSPSLFNLSFRSWGGGSSRGVAGGSLSRRSYSGYGSGHGGAAGSVNRRRSTDVDAGEGAEEQVGGVGVAGDNVEIRQGDGGVDGDSGGRAAAEAAVKKRKMRRSFSTGWRRTAMHMEISASEGGVKAAAAAEMTLRRQQVAAEDTASHHLLERSFSTNY